MSNVIISERMMVSYCVHVYSKGIFTSRSPLFACRSARWRSKPGAISFSRAREFKDYSDLQSLPVWERVLVIAQTYVPVEEAPDIAGPVRASSKRI